MQTPKKNHNWRIFGLILLLCIFLAAFLGFTGLLLQSSNLSKLSESLSSSFSNQINQANQSSQKNLLEQIPELDLGQRIPFAPSQEEKLLPLVSSENEEVVVFEECDLAVKYVKENLKPFQPLPDRLDFNLSLSTFGAVRSLEISCARPDPEVEKEYALLPDNQELNFSHSGELLVYKKPEIVAGENVEVVELKDESKTVDYLVTLGRRSYFFKFFKAPQISFPVEDLIQKFQFQQNSPVPSQNSIFLENQVVWGKLEDRNDFQSLVDLNPTIDVQTAEPGLKEVFIGHNGPPQDRINLVMVQTPDYSEDQEFVTMLSNIFMLDGRPKLVDKQGNPNIEEPSRLSFGFFAVEPMRSNKNKFNIWWLKSEEIENFQPDLLTVNRMARQFDLPKSTYMVSFFKSTETSNAKIPRYTNFPKKEEIVPTVVTMNYPGSGNSASGWAETLTHELSHAVFGLYDEYEDDRERESFTEIARASRWPNAAMDKEAAQEMWGELTGQIDPFYYEWLSLNTQARFQYTQLTEEDFRVGYYSGGCGYAEKTCVIPTKASLMLNNVPVYGPVNRRQVEQVLALFEG